MLPSFVVSFDSLDNSFPLDHGFSALGAPMRNHFVRLLGLCCLLCATTPLLAADVVELLSGAKLEGQIVSRTETQLTIKAVVSGVTTTRVHKLANIHAITKDGQREVINAKPGSATAPGGGGTRAELDALIDSKGRTPPDWFDATPLDYPKTLDLNWPQPPPMTGWNNQLNVGQYIWDVINPNPGRWRPGLKLMHHLLTLHADKPELRERISMQIARMYHDLHEDYARAAFWYRTVGVEKDPVEYSRSAVILAECYWRLGFTNESKKLLSKVRGGLDHAKLLGDMGDVEGSVKMALADAADSPDYAYLQVGDAYRIAGRYQDALLNYRKVLAIEVPAKNPPGRLLKNRNRADANVLAIKSFELFDLSRVADGTYHASSQGYEGQVEVGVVVLSGKITEVKVTQHREKQFYSALSDTPRKIIAKQNVKGIDATSNATITSEAIINATAKAIANPKKP